jgi:RNA polymerase sigma-70 factor (ECF subfamily)
VTQAADLERLLAHADWLRALARRLAGPAADDVVQDTYLAAMQSPPDPERPPRPWLARVVANATRMRFRGESRRVRREDAVAAFAPDAADAPDSTVQRLETHRALVDMILALDEPFRRTTVRHYFDGASLAEIARADGVPEGTVRWRHARALERLRAALDARSGGDRRAWIVALVPAHAPATTGAGLLIGGVVVTKLLVPVVLAIAGILLWQLHARDTAAPAAPAGSSAAISTTTAGGDATAHAPAKVVKLAPDERRRVAERIATARASRHDGASHSAHAASSGPAPALPREGDPGAPIEKATIRDAMREVIPMLADCYGNALPSLNNRGIEIVAQLSLDGDPDVGTIVDAKQLSERDGPPLPAKLDDCMRSTLQTLELPPLAEGDHVEIHYPLVFNPSPPPP